MLNHLPLKQLLLLFSSSTMELKSKINVFPLFGLTSPGFCFASIPLAVTKNATFCLQQCLRCGNTTVIASVQWYNLTISDLKISLPWIFRFSTATQNRPQWAAPANETQLGNWEQKPIPHNHRGRVMERANKSRTPDDWSVCIQGPGWVLCWEQPVFGLCRAT